MAIDTETLSDREKAVLRLLARGFDAKSAARELDLSVHTVNERLRSTRRKLQVTNSREAARLLLEQEDNKKLVHKEFEVGFGAEANDSPMPERSGARTQRTYAPIVGGNVAMSLIIFTALLTLSARDTAGSGPAPKWSVVASPTAAPSKPHNDIRLAGDRMLWDGAEASEAQIRDYLTVIKQLTPQPPTVLSYEAGVPLERIQSVRMMMDRLLNCEPATCFEVTPRAAPLHTNGGAGLAAEQTMESQRLEREVAAMASDVSEALHLQSADNAQLARFLATQVYYRRLSDAVIFEVLQDNSVKLLVTANFDTGALPEIIRVLPAASTPERKAISVSSKGRQGALIRVNGRNGTFLYAGSKSE